MSRSVELAVGTQVWFDGSVWSVQKLTANTVTLCSGERLRAVAIAVLASQAVVMSDAEAANEDDELVAVILGNLSP
ncbi:integrase, partial [Antrihabitans cavernicola]